MKKCGEVWSTLAAKDKKKYDALHEKDQKRYEGELAHLDKHGFFMMADGTKSSDNKAKAKKVKKSKSTGKETESEEDEKPQKIRRTAK